MNQAAELFLAREYDLPYYFGPERIARLASLNIEQFLGLAGTVFEEVVAAELLRGGTQVLQRTQATGILEMNNGYDGIFLESKERRFELYVIDARQGFTREYRDQTYKSPRVS